MRTLIIAGNWKMNNTIDDAVKLVKAMLPELNKVKNVEKIICPPFISLSDVLKLLQKSNVKLGAQNLFYEEKGAYTGEISPLMLAGICDYVIIGHSERRQYFGETNESIDKKVKAAIKMSIKPILCIGEKLEENEAGKTEAVLESQLEAVSNRTYYMGGMVIAYEPIWAIGTGKSATGEQANNTIGFIREQIARKHGENIAASVRILYGGSATAANIAEFMKQPEIDGALVGGASLKAEEFISMVTRASEITGIA